ncbi:MAG: serine protease [Polyangiaceae bacterium]
MKRLLSLVALALAPLLYACGGSTPSAQTAAKHTPKSVFDLVVPSVVAILNDDRAIREEEHQRAMREVGVKKNAPKTVVDVSLRSEPMPHGTGFLIEGGYIVTAAHVVNSPDTLKLTTRDKQTVDAELVHIDEVRDVAILKPKAPLKGVVPIKLAKANPQPGRKVWALGHTGNGLWALSWGISEGVTSGIVDMIGAKLLLFDAPVYPGFSGGPVVMLDDDGEPVVVGVNHAILFTGSMVASISSASSAAEINDVVARKPHPLQAKLAGFAKEHLSSPRAQLFITRNLSVHRDPTMLTSAAISGNERTIEAGADDIARVPVVAMLFGLPVGEHEVLFEMEDPADVVVEKTTKKLKVEPHERVAFASADFRFDPKVNGRYEVIAKIGGKVMGRTDVWVEDPDEDDQPMDTQADAVEDGEPRVDVVVASFGRDDPLTMFGIRAGWVEWRYPRRVGFTWFARGTRGWAGTNVSITAFVLDDKGTIVGRGVGCVRGELRPENTWSCMGTGGSPLVAKEGKYDVVFAMNDRPIAAWPMEAMVRTGKAGSALDRWMTELKKRNQMRRKKPTAPKK